MNFEVLIGLEIHVQLKTKTKMFSASPNSFSLEPNTEVTPFDVAFPGTLPRVNKQAVVFALRVAHALHMSIDPLLRFDRKNYFYSDLPKGYQITQQFHPLGKDGYLDILDEKGNKKRISIERLHIEEDTCKQTHLEDYALLDFNRAGVPLLEIVTKPELSSGFAAMAFAEAIRNIVVYAGVSDGKMEEGSLRCDVNVSLRPTNEKKLGTKVEIKNLNSLKNISDALDYEIARQRTCLLSNEPVQQETRRFEESSGTTVSMRLKSDAADYKYFQDPNIPPIPLLESFIEDAIATCPELYESKLERYQKLGLSKTDAKILLSDPKMASYLEKAVGKKGSLALIIAHFLTVEIQAFLHRKGTEIDELSLLPECLADIASFQEAGYTHKQCNELLEYVLAEGGSAEEARIAKKMEKPSSNEKEVLGFVTAVLDSNPQSIMDYKAGKDRAKGFLIGQVNKLAKGKVNPAAVAKVLEAELAKR